jgi:hypothetical protein
MIFLRWIVPENYPILILRLFWTSLFLKNNQDQIFNPSLMILYKFPLGSILDPSLKLRSPTLDEIMKH